MANKIVGFTIKINGQNDVKTTTQVLGLLNTQLILLNNSINTFDSSASQLGKDIKKSFKSFRDGNKVVQDLGNGYFEVTRKVEQFGKEIQKADEIIEGDSDSIKELIARNKELKKILETAPKAGTEAFEQQSETLKRLAKEYGDNRQEIAKWRKNLNQGKIETEETTGEINKLKERKKELTAAYNNLTKAQQKGLFGQGPKIRRELKKVNQELKNYNDRVRASSGLSATLRKTLTRLFVGRSILSAGANAIRQTTAFLSELVEEGKDTNETFNEISKSGQRLQVTAKNVGTSFLNSFGGTITAIIDNVAFSFEAISNFLFDASENGEIFSTVINTIGQTFRDFPAIIGGVIEVFREFRDRAVKSFTEVSLQLEKAIVNVKRFATAITGGETTEFDQRLKEINKSLEQNVVFSRTVFEAYNEGFSNTKQAQADFNARLEEQRVLEEKIAEEKEKQDKRDKEREAERKKRANELKRDREQLLKDIEAEGQARIILAKEIGQQLQDAEIQNIKDLTERSLAEERLRFDRERAQANENFNARIDQLVQQENRLIALFGEGSNELIDFQQKRDAELQRLRELNNSLSEAQERKHQENLVNIKKEGAKAQLEADKQAFDFELENYEEQYDKELELAGQQSDKLIAQSIEADKKRNQATKDSVINLVNSVFGAISAIQEAAFAAENAMFEKAIEDRQANIDQLNEDIQNATGLQKKFLQSQLENEKKSLEEETKAKEEARKKQGEAQKAISITQAIIAAALGVANAFTLPPPASFIAAAATAVATAAQIAIIASQKFAKGGLVGANAPVNVGNGLISNTPNINTQPNGDNILATVKKGEVILNARQQAALGGARTFRAIGVPGFNTGGIVGAPISAPNIGNSPSNVDEKFNQFIDVTMAMNEAVNNRIDNIQVNLDLNNLQDVQDNDNELRAMTTFG